jgi:hypothetical protein
VNASERRSCRNRRFLGAALLGFILIGAVLTHIVNQDPLSQAVMAPICLALVGLVAWTTRPAAFAPNRT